MDANVYTRIAESLCRIGKIDRVGVVSDVGTTSILFGGVGSDRKYFDGTHKMSLRYNVTGIDTNPNRLVKRLCDIGETLKSEISSAQIDGVSQPKITINSTPIPTTQDGHSWIYVTGITLECYYKNNKRRQNI